MSASSTNPIGLKVHDDDEYVLSNAEEAEIPNLCDGEILSAKGKKIVKNVISATTSLFAALAIGALSGAEIMALTVVIIAGAAALAAALPYIAGAAAIGAVVLGVVAVAGLVIYAAKEILYPPQETESISGEPVQLTITYDEGFVPPSPPEKEKKS